MIEPNDSNFRLTDQEAKQAASDMTTKALYILLGVIVLITAGHGVMLVLLTSETLAFVGLTGLILNVIRVAFPVVTEWGAVVAGLGFINAKWRKGQKTVALLIEIVWVVFAAANMITVFAIERNQQLQGWQNSWISYGLPLSALIQAILVYSLKRTDPDAKRLNEEAAAMEEVKMTRFAAKRDVALSSQMKAIEKQKQWLEFVNELRTRGYTEAQIRFILADTPQLLIDGNRNGTPDLLEAGDSASPPSPTQSKPDWMQSTGGPYTTEIYTSHNWKVVGSHPDEQSALRMAHGFHHTADADVRVCFSGQQIGSIIRSKVPHRAGHHSSAPSMNDAPRQANGVPDFEDTITVDPPQRQRVASEGQPPVNFPRRASGPE